MRTLVRFFAKGFIILLVTLTCIEVMARMFVRVESYQVHPSSEFTHDALLGWKGIPGYEGVSPLTRARISINRHGFRDRDWDQTLDRARNLGLTRVLFLGDSLAYGYEIEVWERLSDQLAELYGLEGAEIAVFNAAIPAYGTDLEFRAYELLAPLLEPQVVVLQYCPNDIGDAALPYCWANPRRRVYKPYYDLEGDLLLNALVPKRFSLRVEGTWLASLATRYLVDMGESLLDDITYRRYGVSENRRVQAAQPEADHAGFVRRVWDMGALTAHPGFRDLYDKNKWRNFRLLSKLNRLCQDQGRRLLVLTDFDGHPDPRHPDQELITYLKEDGIAWVNVARGQAFLPWGFVNLDGHPNALANYAAAANLFQALEGRPSRAAMHRLRWFRELAAEIDFARGDFHRYLFGGQWGSLKTQQTRAGRWLDGPGKLLLKDTGEPGPQTLRVSGFNPTSGNAIRVGNRQNQAAGPLALPLPGDFQVDIPIVAEDPKGLLLLELQAESPVFIYSIKPAGTTG
jgi:lysophospholipase L1-like esterase